ncbi:ATP synthase E chain-domain-containing protein [Umbelopsis sp. PMI_123]|nr:ATP synthase E chain-domain-containing protein [Umbelopsis sp. PMI_123]
MVNASFVNVGRWSALGLGVLYGVVHNRSLHKLEAENKVKHEYERKERLIEQARAEYAKLHAKAADSSVVTDVDNPNFDLEKFIAQLESQDKQ